MKWRRKREGGFSLLELIVVVVVVLIVSAMAMPSFFNMIYNIRLRSSAQTVAGMMQTCRMQAVRDNKYYFIKYAAIGGSTIVWVTDQSAATAPAANEPQAQLGSNVQIVVAGNPSGPTLSFTPIMDRPPAFNSRGVPCLQSGGRCVSNITIIGLGNRIAAFELYLTDSRPVGANGWATVVVSPAGRIQTFSYNGSTWGS
jgi:prepilin-type N-terminal cleavage/methylation domain-containing protein